MTPNGAIDHKHRFDKVDQKLVDIENSLIDAVRAQTSATLQQAGSITKLNSSVEMLTKEIGLARGAAENAVPIKMVALMFLILMLSIAGIEVLKFLPKWLMAI